MTSKSKTQSSRFDESASSLTESDFAQERMGNNKLQGNDQEDVRNQRKAVPGVKTEAEGVIESFENMDPETRAKRAEKP